MNYFISYYDHSAAKWRLWFDWKERAQDRECLRRKHKGNEYKHCCEFHARRFYQNQSPFIILLRDLPAQVLKAPVLIRWRAIDRHAVPSPDRIFLRCCSSDPYVFPLWVVITISRGCYVYYSHRIVGELSEQFTIRASLETHVRLVLTKIAPI